MSRINNTIITALVVLILIGLPAASAAQSMNDLVGSWTLVSSTVERNGGKFDQFGPNPKGTLTLGKNGHWAVIMLRSDLPSFASKDRLTGTADENKAIAQGVLAYFGKYRLNEAEHTIQVQIESASFPNWAGTTQKRGYEVSGDELTLIANPALGGGIARIVWKRMP